MGAPSKITPEQMYELKSDLWNGADHMEMMEKYGISYQTSVLAKSGKAYHYIPWPDGSTGPMPKSRRDELANAKKYVNRADRAGHRAIGETIGGSIYDRPLTLADRQGLDETANRLGFRNWQAYEEHQWRQRIDEQTRKTNEDQRLRSIEYEKRQAKHEEHLKRLESDPEYREQWEASQPPARVHLPKDQTDPEANEKLDWDEIVFMAGGKLKIVQTLDEAMDQAEPALKPAIQIVLKLFPQRQWGEDHVLKMIFIIKRNIENFWEANPLRDPRRDYQMLDDLDDATASFDSK